MRDGELNLVIACDKIPPGLPDVVAGIASQSALGFDLDLVEVVPYVREVSDTAEIMFVPSTRLATEIVARTAVTVTYRQGDARPSTSVELTSLEEVAEGIRNAKSGRSPDVRFMDRRRPLRSKFAAVASQPLSACSNSSSVKVLTAGTLQKGGRLVRHLDFTFRESFPPVRRRLAWSSSTTSARDT